MILDELLTTYLRTHAYRWQLACRKLHEEVVSALQEYSFASRYSILHSAGKGYPPGMLQRAMFMQSCDNKVPFCIFMQRMYGSNDLLAQPAYTMLKLSDTMGHKPGL